MVTTNQYSNNFVGLSDDDKPVSYIKNGSTFTEIDTGKTYMFDEDSNSWFLTSNNSSGGSGGNDSMAVEIINLMPNNLTTSTRIFDTDLTMEKV
jgi:hypothetical protein